MRVLAFDTATRATAVALCDLPLGSGLVSQARDDPPAGARPGHASRLLELVARLVDGDGGWGRVDRIAVGIGPGTFTGLRIGVATAHGLARARGIGLVGVSTLRSLALDARRVEPEPERGVIALVDARRGELFAAGWGRDEDPALLAPRVGPYAAAPDRIGEALTALGPRPMAVGDGAILFREMLEREGAFVPAETSTLHAVSGLAHCVLGAAMPVQGLGLVRPEYLRVPDAELAKARPA